MVVFAIALLFCVTAALALAVIAHALVEARRACAETRAALADCGDYREAQFRITDLEVRYAAPRPRARPVMVASRPHLPQRRLLRAAA